MVCVSLTSCLPSVLLSCHVLQRADAGATPDVVTPPRTDSLGFMMNATWWCVGGGL